MSTHVVVFLSSVRRRSTFIMILVSIDFIKSLHLLPFVGQKQTSEEFCFSSTLSSADIDIKKNFISSMDIQRTTSSSS